MSVLSPFTATLFSIVAAAYWAILFLLRLYRRPLYFEASKSKKIISAFIAALAFLPALFISYYLSFPIGNLFLRPGPAIHILLSLNVALCISIIGALLTFMLGHVSLYLLTRVDRRAKVD